MKITSRKLGVLATVAAFSLTISGCAATEPAETDSASGSECVIGMVQINQTAAFFTEMNRGAEEAAAEVGCELTISNANNDSAKQASDIENFITQGVTGLIVVAIDVNGVLPGVQSAMAAGVKVIAVDAKLEDGSYDTFVGVDNEAARAVIGQWAVDNGYAEGSYGVVGAKNSFIQNQREDAFRAVVDGAGATFTQSVSGDNVQEQAADAAVTGVEGTKGP